MAPANANKTHNSTLVGETSRFDVFGAGNADQSRHVKPVGPGAPFPEIANAAKSPNIGVPTVS